MLTIGCMILGGGYAGVSFLTAERLTRPTNHPLRIDPRRISPDAEPWSARTADGLTLRGWYLPTRERRHLIVLVHGMWSSWLEMASLGRDLHHRGYDVLLFDLRGHGQSDPSRLSLGRRERADIRTVMAGRRRRASRRIASAGSAIRWGPRPCSWRRPRTTRSRSW